MTVKEAGRLFVFLVFYAGVVHSTLADSSDAPRPQNEVLDLQNQVSDLSRRIAELERSARTMEGHISAAQGKEAVSSAVPPGQETTGGLIHTRQDLHMGGYVDVEYNQNLSAGTSNIAGNPLRSFDGNQNTFSLAAAELDFQRIPNPKGGAGFRLDIAMGENNQFIDALTLGTDGDEFGLQESYVELIAPLEFLDGHEIFGQAIDFKIGRFATLAGAEVFEPLGNWNISRSFLFGLAEPASHTGLRSQYKLFQDTVTIYLGVNNGWDSVIDNNMFKTIEAGFNVTAGGLSVTSVLYGGPETARQGGHKRYLLSNVFAWQASDKLQFLGCIDFGSERRVPGLEGRAFENAQWHGYAGYVRYQLDSKWATAYRVEFLRDDDTYRTGLGGSVAPSLWEQTLTLEYQFDEYLTGRLEYRFDKSEDTPAFNGDSSQSTLGSQMVYNFA